MADKSKGVDLMVALGVPKKGASGNDSPDDNSSSKYWDDKPAELKGYLMDAVDDKLSQQERAESLCRAMEAHLEHTAGDEEDSSGDDKVDSGDDSSDSDY